MLQQSVWWAVGGMAGYVAVHLALARWRRPRLYFRFSWRLLIAWLAACAWLSWRVGSLRGAAHLHSLLLLGSFWILYMEATYIVMRSVSVRTLVELTRAPGGRLAEEDLERLYQTEQMFDHRIASMEANGYLARTNGHFALTTRGARLAQACGLMRRALNLRTYG